METPSYEPARRLPGPARALQPSDIARRATEAFIGLPYEGKLAPSARVRMVSGREVERRLGTSKGFLGRHRQIDASKLLQLLLVELAASGELSRTAGSVAESLTNMKRVRQSTVEAAARTVFTASLARIRRPDYPYAGLRGRMLLWVGARHATDGVEIIKHLKTIHDRDVQQILTSYGQVFKEAGIRMSDSKLRDFVETVSAGLDGMLIRAELAENDEVWSDRFAKFVVSQIRAVAPTFVS